jgi:cysteine dioxygenase
MYESSIFILDKKAAMRTETHPPLTSKFDKLVTLIEERNQIDSETLIQLLKEIKFESSDMEPYQDFNHDPSLSYARKRIYEGDSFVIYLMSWSKGDFTAIHSHGSTDWGAVYFLSDIRHRLYEVHDKHIKLVDKSIVPKDTIVPVKGDLVHAMGNQTGLPSMSLHIYGSNRLQSNANDGSLVYEIEKKLIRTTHGEAYLNMKEENCLATETGLSADVETMTDYLTIILPYYRKNGLVKISTYIESILDNPALYYDPKFTI